MVSGLVMKPKTTDKGKAMTRPKEDNTMMKNTREQMLALLQSDDALRALLETTVQQVLEVEMDEAIGASKSERTGERRGYRSGYYGRKLTTRIGTLTYDLSWNLLSERTLTGSQVGEYIHGPRIDESLQWIRSDGAKLYPLVDGLGSTVALTNDHGRVVERYRFTAYGTPTVLNANHQLPPGANATDYRFLFTGREWLSQVGLNDHRNRYCSPDLGRLLTTDPIQFSGGLNLYDYVENNPVSFFDPTGLKRTTGTFMYNAPSTYIVPSDTGYDTITSLTTITRNAYVDYSCKCNSKNQDGSVNYSLSVTGYGWVDGGYISPGISFSIWNLSFTAGDSLTMGFPSSGPNSMDIPLSWKSTVAVSFSLKAKIPDTGVPVGTKTPSVSFVDDTITITISLTCP